jgi:hypothetical protein
MNSKEIVLRKYSDANACVDDDGYSILIVAPNYFKRFIYRRR